MARDESNREDLLREATALVERIELVTSAGERIVAGFRANGALSIFFGYDPVYQFNATGELRRAYFKGQLYKATRRRLVSLNRERTAAEVQLVHHELSDTEQQVFLIATTEHLRGLRALLKTGDFDVRGQVPPDTNLLARLRNWLEAYSEPQIAPRPNA